jgi:hypothetical protein
VLDFDNNVIKVGQKEITGEDDVKILGFSPIIHQPVPVVIPNDINTTNVNSNTFIPVSDSNSSSGTSNSSS